MKKVFILSLFLVFSSGKVMAENDLIIMRQVVGGTASDANPLSAEVIGIDSSTGTETQLLTFNITHSSAAGDSFTNEHTGEYFIGNGFGKYTIYNANTNTVSVKTFSAAVKTLPWGGDNVLSFTNEDAEIKIDETNNTVNIDNAALSDGDGTNMITLEDDGSVSLGGDDLIVIDDEGISIDGKQLIAEKEDGAIHIGENSLITVEQDGVQKLYAEDENGDAIDIDITNGSDLLINGVSVEERLNSNNTTYVDTVAASTLTSANSYTDTVANKLADGIEDSNAMSAALAALPNTAPDAEAYCGGGLGSYGNSQAFSLGCASNINDDFAVNFVASKLSSSGASIGNRDFDDYSLKAGFIYKIGYKPSKSSKSNTATLETELYRQQASLRAIAEKEDYKDTKIAEYEKRLAKLEDQLEELKVAMLAGNKEFASLAK